MNKHLLELAKHISDSGGNMSRIKPEKIAEFNKLDKASVMRLIDLLMIINPNMRVKSALMDLKLKNYYYDPRMYLLIISMCLAKA